jgi:hypothetical protein
MVAGFDLWLGRRVSDYEDAVVRIAFQRTKPSKVGECRSFENDIKNDKETNAERYRLFRQGYRLARP